MKKKNKLGYNKQGIKLLDHLPGKSRGIRLEMPPDMSGNICNHSSIKTDADGDSSCTKCGFLFY
jgi:hypothetical protein